LTILIDLFAHFALFFDRSTTCFDHLVAELTIY